MSNSDRPSMWKVIQGLNGTPDANSSNKAMSHNGCNISSIKTKANISVHRYSRVSKLNMSKADCDLNRHFKKHSTLHQLTMKVVFHFKCVSYCLPLNRRRVKEQRVLTTFLHLFLKHLVFWPFRNYYPYLIHLSLLLTPQESGGLPLSFHYWKLWNHQVKFRLSAHFSKELLLIVFTTS